MLQAVKLTQSAHDGNGPHGQAEGDGTRAQKGGRARTGGIAEKDERVSTPLGTTESARVWRKDSENAKALSARRRANTPVQTWKHGRMGAARRSTMAEAMVATSDAMAVSSVGSAKNKEQEDGGGGGGGGGGEDGSRGGVGGDGAGCGTLVR